MEAENVSVNLSKGGRITIFFINTALNVHFNVFDINLKEHKWKNGPKFLYYANISELVFSKIKKAVQYIPEDCRRLWFDD
jgi:hypothetical protein